MSDAKKIAPLQAAFAEELSSADKAAVVQFVEIAKKLTGVQLTARHHSMIASRLKKRVSDLRLGSLADYIKYYKINSATESEKLIALVTTHHTFFFREFSHFEYIQNTLLPKMLPLLKQRSDKTLRVWAAACSRGHEVYSLAMFLDFHLKRLDPNLKFKIVGTDIDSESVEIAKNGVYLRSDLKEAPLALLSDHWAQGTGDISAYVKAKKSLTEKCSFFTTNLLELDKSTAVKKGEMFDIIFCRNVFIYFNADQIKQISDDLLKHLSPHGYLFIGVSESIGNLGLQVSSAGPAIYIHKAAEAAPTQTNKETNKSTNQEARATPASTKVAIVPNPSPIRVLCVDDSPTILALLKQILTEKDGFQIVGTAMNGIEASKKREELKPDLMTLDIHMPEQTGIEYLQKNFNSAHPPVMMITSVSRDDSGLAGKALSLGAGDYVEKPALTNLKERGDEIRAKLKCLHQYRNIKNDTLQFDKQFLIEKKIKTPDHKLRVVVATLSNRNALKKLVKDLGAGQPPLVLLMDGAKSVLPSFADTLSTDLGKKVHYSDSPQSLFKPDEIYLLDLATQAEVASAFAKGKAVSVMVYGELAEKSAQALLKFENAHLMLEDLGGGLGAKHLMDLASEVVLGTSFAYISNEYFMTEETKRSA